MKTVQPKEQTAPGSWKTSKTKVGRKKRPPVDMASEFLRRKGLKNAD